MIDKTLPALAALALLACASEPRCPRPTGLWLMHLIERPGGACGAQADELDEIGPAASDSACTGGVDYAWSEDDCSLDSVLRGCNNGGDARGTVSTSWRHVTDEQWTGVMDVRIDAPSGGCHSVYDVQASRR